jgi:hypothetical protein
VTEMSASKSALYSFTPQSWKAHSRPLGGPRSPRYAPGT